MHSVCVNSTGLQSAGLTPKALAFAVQTNRVVKAFPHLCIQKPQNSSKHSEETNNLRQQLAQSFPNSLLLEAQQLPKLYSSRHFVNLTNGLELAPVLQELHLPFSVIRIRSTNLEQQSYEALMLELDANLLFSLALGHSCIIWDCGSRNRQNGAPRAIWYGLEFIRFALNRFWLDRRDHAHLRGHDVSASFETACRNFHPTTKKRLRYYKRFLSDAVKQQGVQLYGVFQKTDKDEDVQFFVMMAVQYCGAQIEQRVRSTAGSSCIDQQMPTDKETDAFWQGFDVRAHVNSADHSRFREESQAYRSLVARGLGMFAAGISHSQYRDLQQQMYNNRSTESEPYCP